MANSSNNEEAVCERAYQLWEADGRPHGRAESHWHAAAAELPGQGAMQGAAQPQGEAGLVKVRRRRVAEKPGTESSGKTA